MKIAQTINFDAAHRLLGYNGNCSSLHGHTWSVDIEIDSDRKMDEVGMLLDYRTIKQYFKDYYDHKTILNMDDPLVDILKANNACVTIMKGNPTAENLAIKIMADFILLTNASEFDYINIRVHESADNFAEVNNFDGARL